MSICLKVLSMFFVKTSEPKSFILNKLINGFIDNLIVFNLFLLNHIHFTHFSIAHDIIGIWKITIIIKFLLIIFILFNKLKRINTFITFKITNLVIFILFLHESFEHVIQSSLVYNLFWLSFYLFFYVVFFSLQS